MDKETIALVEDVRKSLIDFGKKATSSSVKKKTRKVTSQILWEPGPYLDELDNILSTSKNKNEAVMRVRSLVRQSEEQALSTMNLLPDDTMHHIVQSRTGGDALTDLPYERTGPIIEGLSKKHQMTFGNTTGPGSNLPAEMSLSNFAHKADDRATGLERESGVGKNPDKMTTAHPKGTAGEASMKGVDLTSDAAITEALDQKITRQVEAAQIAAATDAPRQQAIRDLTGNPLAYSGTAEDVASARLSALQLDPADVKKSYQALTAAGGSMTYGMKLGALLPVAGVAFDLLDADDKIKRAQQPDANLLDKAQAGIASVTAATAPIPEPISQTVNAVGGGINLAIDLGRDFFNMLTTPRQPTEEDLDFSTL